MLNSFLPRLEALLAQPDKQQHILCSFVIYVLAYALLSVSVALILTLFIGLLKEVWDKYYGSGFCYFDLLSNCIGVGLAMPAVYLIQASTLR